MRFALKVLIRSAVLASIALALLLYWFGPTADTEAKWAYWFALFAAAIIFSPFPKGKYDSIDRC